jgi:hypothetical protein
MAGSRTKREISDSDVARTVPAVQSLGDPSTWTSPVTLTGLAECVLNSIYSTGNRSESVVKVLNRYRSRRGAGADPSQDGPEDLLAEIESCGGPEGFADALGNHWRAWQDKSAPCKTQAIFEAAQLLKAEAVRDRHDLEVALGTADVHSRLKGGWLRIPGQRSGLTWRYFLMNSGMPGIKADRMITRWTSRAVGRTVASSEAETILTRAAEALGLETRRLDHAVWSSERDRERQG